MKNFPGGKELNERMMIKGVTAGELILKGSTSYAISTKVLCAGIFLLAS